MFLMTLLLQVRNVNLKKVVKKSTNNERAAPTVAVIENDVKKNRRGGNILVTGKEYQRLDNYT